MLSWIGYASTSLGLWKLETTASTTPISAKAEEPWGKGESHCPWEPRHEREPECKRDTGASVSRADSEEVTPLVVFMLFLLGC